MFCSLTSFITRFFLGVRRQSAQCRVMLLSPWTISHWAAADWQFSFSLFFQMIQCTNVARLLVSFVVYTHALPLILPHTYTYFYFILAWFLSTVVFFTTPTIFTIFTLLLFRFLHFLLHLVFSTGLPFAMHFTISVFGHFFRMQVNPAVNKQHKIDSLQINSV